MQATANPVHFKLIRVNLGKLERILEGKLSQDSQRGVPKCVLWLETFHKIQICCVEICQWCKTTVC